MAANVSPDVSDTPRKSMLPGVGRAYNLLHSALSPASAPDLEGAPVRPRLHRRFWSQGPSSLPKSALEQIRASFALTSADDPLPPESKPEDRMRIDNVNGDVEKDALLSKRHVEQGLRLASQALSEDQVSHVEGRDFVADLYISSLEYLLSACRPLLFATTPPARRTSLHAKLTSLLLLVDDASVPVPPFQDASGTSTSASFSLWHLPLTHHTPAPITNIDPHSPPRSPPIASTSTSMSATETLLHTSCPSCHASISLRVPDSLRTKPSASDGHPRTWSDLIVLALVSLALAVRDSPLPALLSALWAWAVSMNERYQLVRKAALVLAWLVELARAYGLHTKVAEAGSVLVEGAVRAGVALASASPAVRVEEVKLPEGREGGVPFPAYRA